MRPVDATERRRRLGVRHRLAGAATDPVEVARSLTALHSSDPATVFLSTRARVDGFETSDLEHALYEERSLVRMYGMRRTLWVVPTELVAIVDSSSTREIARRERKRTVKLLEDGGVADDGEEWLREVVPEALAEIRARGEVLTRDMTTSIPALDGKIEVHNQKGELMGSTGLASRVILQLAMESQLVRARPTGTWISSQYRWAEMEEWLGSPLEALEPTDARRALLRSWLHSFGPATETDIKWWTGWRVTDVRMALSELPAEEVDLDGQPGWVLADDLEPVAAPDPWIALLPSLDPTTMGWKERTWYMGDHSDRLFDRNGNAGPTVWVDGRVVGGWAQRKTGEVVYEIFDDVGAEREAMIEQEAATVQEWLGEITITPRFRSPHDKQLAP